MKRAALNLRVSTVENGQARPNHCSIGDSSRGTLPLFGGWPPPRGPCERLFCELLHANQTSLDGTTKGRELIESRLWHIVIFVNLPATIGIARGWPRAFSRLRHPSACA